MIYAKCIRGSQIAKNKDDLEKMKEISNNTVYCEGEEAEPKNPYASLDCVPLNCIFQCLKYGNYIAIIENEEFDYTKDYDGNAIAISNYRNDTTIYKIIIRRLSVNLTVFFISSKNFHTTHRT